MPKDLHPTAGETNKAVHLPPPADNAELIQTLLQTLFDDFNVVAPHNTTPLTGAHLLGGI